MTNLTRTNRNGKRPKSNFYPTPPPATRALIGVEQQSLVGRTIWECAAGDGAMGFEFWRSGFDVVMTEKRDGKGASRGRDGRPAIHGGRDFFAERRCLGDVIITNPPYGRKILDRFIRHALSLQPEMACFFLPLTYMTGIERADLIEGVFCGMRLDRVLVFRERLTLGPKGLKLNNSGVVAYGWYVWTPGDAPAPFTVIRVSGHALPYVPSAHLRTGRLPRDFEGTPV